jgi:hypothetical protein
MQLRWRRKKTTEFGGVSAWPQMRETIVGVDSPEQILKRMSAPKFFNDPVNESRWRFRRQRCRDRYASRNCGGRQLIQNSSHLFNGLYSGDRLGRIGKCERDRSDQPAIDINGTAAHSPE